MDKIRLKKQCIIKRNNLSEEEHKKASTIIQEKCLAFLYPNTIIGFYKSTQNEVDINTLIQIHEKQGICALPKIEPNQKMSFYKIGDSKEYEINSYGIEEPIAKEYNKMKRLDLIFIPMVGFDEKGNRLGFGKGYYDRFLKKTSAKKIGIAFECQKIASIPIQSYDVAMDIIITEQNIYECN